VLAAIAEHTFGSPVMGPLSMVVYVADVIEPDRGHPYVSELRESVGRMPLAQLFAEAYAASLAHLVAKRRPIHSVTLDVWNALVARERR
jgi:HD superfamily phosphohydrolase YqeK